MAVKHDHTITFAGTRATGGKGIRSYDWAMLAIDADNVPDGQQQRPGHSVLLVRRHRYTRKPSFYRCWNPRPVPLSRLVAVATIRWRIEEDHQLAKQTSGLDKGQTRTWTSRHRWTALTLLAYTFLVVGTAQERPDHHPRTPPRPRPQERLEPLVFLALVQASPRKGPHPFDAASKFAVISSMGVFWGLLVLLLTFPLVWAGFLRPRWYAVTFLSITVLVVRQFFFPPYA